MCTYEYFESLNEKLLQTIKFRCADARKERKYWSSKSVHYFKNKLGDIPITIKKATQDYFDENDDLGAMLTDLCEVDKNVFVYSSVLYDLYVKITGKKISHKSFSTMMKERGYIFKKKEDGNVITGLQFKNKLDD